MPTIIELGSIQLRVYPRDHFPPHFHISTPSGEAVIRLSDLALIKGKIRKSELAKALNWAEKNKRVIEDEWRKQNG